MTASNYVTQRFLPAVLAASGLFAAGQPASAAELGIHVSALRADTNLSGIGMTVRWPLRSGWFVDATLDRQRYDFERIDNVAAVTDLQSIVAGAAIGHSNNIGDTDVSWFWTWGLAVGFPTSSRASGTQSDARTTAATEIHLTGSMGLSRKINNHWSLTGAARAERRFIDWRVMADDGELLEKHSSLSPAGVYFAVSYRF